MQTQIAMPSHDDTALALLYQRHMPVLLAFIRRYVSTREDAEDVLLETFIAAFERNSLANLNDGEQLAWLRRVAHNKCVDVYRRTPHQPVVPLENVTDILYEDEEQAPEQVALRSEEYALLRAHLANLSEQQQTILHLRFAHGLRSTEIAKRLDKSEGAVRMLLSRTLNFLRQIYEKPEEGNSKDE
jgi:RNA polymerase sigma factor (sigma-70 family)